MLWFSPRWESSLCSGFLNSGCQVYVRVFSMLGVKFVLEFYQRWESSFKCVRVFSTLAVKFVVGFFQRGE